MCVCVHACVCAHTCVHELGTQLAWYTISANSWKGLCKEEGSVLKVSLQVYICFLHSVMMVGGKMCNTAIITIVCA